MKINILFIVGFLSFMIVSFVQNMISINLTGNGTADSTTFYIQLLFMFFCFFFILSRYKICLKAPKVFRYAFLFGFIIFFPTAFYHKGVLLELVKTIMDIWMWIYCFMIGYLVAYSKKENGLLLTNLLLLFTLPMIGYSIYLYLSVNLLVADIKTADVALILLAIFPLTLRLKNEALKILTIIFIGLIAMLSFKRTIILGVVMMASVYYYSILTKTKFLRWQKVVFSLILIIGGIALYRAFNFIEQESGGYILSRLSSIQEDRGSRRVDIYGELLESFASSNIGEMLFGHGYLATAKYTQLEILAHNDFLEIIFDFGLIGLIAYLAFFFSLLGYSRKIYQYRNLLDINSSIFIAGLIAFLFLGLLNCFITTPIYFSTVILFFGLSIGDFEREKLKLKSQEQNQ